MIQRFLLPAVLIVPIFLGACSEPVDEGAAAKRDDGIASAPITSLGERQTAWSYETDAADGATLTYFQPAGTPALRLACDRDDAALIVAAPQMQRTGSEERLTFEAGGRLEALVVDQQVTAPSGSVVARGPLTPELAAALGGGEFAISYGANALQPASVPREEVLTGFATACKAALSAEAARSERERIVGE